MSIIFYYYELVLKDYTHVAFLYDKYNIVVLFLSKNSWLHLYVVHCGVCR